MVPLQARQRDFTVSRDEWSERTRLVATAISLDTGRAPGAEHVSVEFVEATIVFHEI